VIVCFTVDLEPDCPPYLSGWRGLEEGTPLLLALLEREQVPATFFCTGEAAERFPRRVEAIVAAGTSSARTARPTAPSGDGAAAGPRRDPRSARALRRFAPVVSFRAPFLRLPHAYRDLLADEGFRLDSSDARYKLDWYRTRDLPSPLFAGAGLGHLLGAAPAAAARDPWLGWRRCAPRSCSSCTPGSSWTCAGNGCAPTAVSGPASRRSAMPRRCEGCAAAGRGSAG
jgi:hypothetical protein